MTKLLIFSLLILAGCGGASSPTAPTPPPVVPPPVVTPPNYYAINAGSYNLVTVNGQTLPVRYTSGNGEWIEIESGSAVLDGSCDGTNACHFAAILVTTSTSPNYVGYGLLITGNGTWSTDGATASLPTYCHSTGTFLNGHLIVPYSNDCALQPAQSFNLDFKKQ